MIFQIILPVSWVSVTLCQICQVRLRILSLKGKRNTTCPHKNQMKDRESVYMSVFLDEILFLEIIISLRKDDYKLFHGTNGTKVNLDHQSARWRIQVGIILLQVLRRYQVKSHCRIFLNEIELTSYQLYFSD